METPRIINSFQGGYAFLSNFYEGAPLLFNGLHYQNSEAAYQAGKARFPVMRLLFINKKPGAAKQLGKRIPIRGDWDQVKADYMTKVVHAKFTQNPRIAQALIETSDTPLEEGNYWHDNFFGNCYCPKCRSIPGENVLGKILMQERELLKGRNGGSGWGYQSNTKPTEREVYGGSVW